MPHHPAIHPDETTEQSHHDYLTRLAMIIAERDAMALAKVTRRRGAAHRHLIAAHLLHLLDGAGEAAAFGFIDQLVADMQGLHRG